MPEPHILSQAEIEAIRQRYETIKDSRFAVLEIMDAGRTMAQLACEDIPNLLETVDATREALEGIVRRFAKGQITKDREWRCVNCLYTIKNGSGHGDGCLVADVEAALGKIN